jgi:hypothetical protein
MIKKLKTLLGDDNNDEPPRNDPTVRETVNHFANGDYHISTETIQKGDTGEYTVRVAFGAAGYQYDQRDSIAGVLRSYDGSVTIEENIRDYIADTGEMPVDGWTGNKSPDHILHAIAIIPGEYIEEAESSQYLAVPIWEDEEV